MEETTSITGDMTIGEMVQQFPSVADVLQDEGVNCVGCGAAYYETINEGLASHGKTEEEIEMILKKLNDSIPKEEGNDDFIITDLAIAKIKDVCEQKDKKALRVKVLKGGCAGFSYDFSLENESNKDDKVIEISGVKVFIDEETMNMLDGSKLDYVDSLTGAGFKISNPNAAKTCGCGQSFN